MKDYMIEIGKTDGGKIIEIPDISIALVLIIIFSFFILINQNRNEQKK